MGEVNFTWKPWGTCKPEKVDHHPRAFCCLFPAALLYSITTGSFLKICHLRRPAEETSNDLWIDKEIKARYLDTIHFFESSFSQELRQHNCKSYLCEEILMEKTRTIKPMQKALGVSQSMDQLMSSITLQDYLPKFLRSFAFCGQHIDTSDT